MRWTDLFPIESGAEHSLFERHARSAVGKHLSRDSDLDGIGDLGRFVREAAERPVDLGDLAALAAVDPTALEPEDRVSLIRAMERAKSALEGAQQRALAAVVEATTALGLEGEDARHEVGAALRLSSGTAASRTIVADELVHRLPDVLAALCAGDITYLQARHLAEAVRPLSDEVARAVAARVLPRAGEQTLAEFRRAVDRAVVAADPAGATERHQRVRDARAIRREVLPDAMRGWWVTLPADQEEGAWDTLTHQARDAQALLRAGAGIDPGLDALRVDALVAAIEAIAAGASPGGAASQSSTSTSESASASRSESASASRSESASASTNESSSAPATEETSAATSAEADSMPASAMQPPATSQSPTPPPAATSPLARCRCGGAAGVGVVIDLPTLLGLVDNPAELTGYGPIPAQVARELAADRDWERWVTHPTTGELLDLQPHRYRPSDRLRRHVAAARRRCGFPGCYQPAEVCDIDHRVTFREGGRTITVNLGPLCRQHHNAKTHGGWLLTYDVEAEAWMWTSPLGHRYPCGSDPPLPV